MWETEEVGALHIYKVADILEEDYTRIQPEDAH
jgi:hypothetical protein